MDKQLLQRSCFPAWLHPDGGKKPAPELAGREEHAWHVRGVPDIAGGRAGCLQKKAPPARGRKGLYLAAVPRFFTAKG